MELNKVLEMVRGLVAKAEHPSTEEAEARIYRTKADALMLKYAIEEATLAANTPAHQRTKPGKIRIDLCQCGSPFEVNIIRVATEVAEHCRVKIILHNAGEKADSDKAAYGAHCYSSAFGFESDLKFFEMLFTTLSLHLANGIDPSIDYGLSEDDNAYALHTAGLNWLDIAKMYGWSPDEFSTEKGTKRTWTHRYGLKSSTESQVGSHYKRAYYRAVKVRGEDPIKLPAGSKRITYQRNFARAYAAKIGQRLAEARQARDYGSKELVLASRFDEINDLINATFPVMGGFYSPDEDNLPFNQIAWEAGNNHASRAALGATEVVNAQQGISR